MTTPSRRPRPERPLALATAALLSLSLWSCDPASPEEPPQPLPSAHGGSGLPRGPAPSMGTNSDAVIQVPEPITYDFGTIVHGARPSQDLEIPFPETDGIPLVPLAFQTTCSCAQHRFLIRSADGSLRELKRDGLRLDDQSLAADETLILRLTIESARKEPVDLASQTVNGNVVLQEAAAGHRRYFIRVQFRYAIDSLVTLKPFSHLDFGDIARPVELTLPVVLDLGESGAELGTPQATENVAGGAALRTPQDLTVSLRRDEANWLLEATFQPANNRPLGPFLFKIVLPTGLRIDDRDYALEIPVSGRVVPAVQISPPEAFSFGSIPFDAPREQSLVVTDHDTAREPGLAALGIVDSEGNDQSEHFEISILPLALQTRARRVVLRYLGTLDQSSFRGQVLLGKTAEGPELLRIDYVGFRRRKR